MDRYDDVFQTDTNMNTNTSHFFSTYLIVFQKGSDIMCFETGIQYHRTPPPKKTKQKKPVSEQVVFTLLQGRMRNQIRSS